MYLGLWFLIGLLIGLVSNSLIFEDKAEHEALKIANLLLSTVLSGLWLLILVTGYVVYKLLG